MRSLKGAKKDAWFSYQRIRWLIPVTLPSSVFNVYFDLENAHMRNEMNSNRYEISIWLKMSLRCSINSLLVFTWIEAKWNAKRYGFHIGHFDRNQISNRHEIFMWTKFIQSEMNKILRWIFCLMWTCVWNSLWVLFHYFIVVILREMKFHFGW